MHFSDLLEENILKKGSSICVGYDPRIEMMPEELKKECDHSIENCIVQFGTFLIDTVQDLVPVIKFQWAFFLQHGFKGLQALHTLMQYASGKGMVILLDAKVGDIGSTSEAYARALLHPEGEFGRYVHALTVNPYLGADAIEPFKSVADEYEKGLFILLKTSNPGSKDIQDLSCEHGTVYLHVADLIEEFGSMDLGDNGLSNVGAVVGATHPEHAAILREKMPKTWFLVPGYGAQGGTIDTIKPTFMANGLGALIVSARGINYAYTKKEYKGMHYKEAIRKAAEDMYTALQQFSKK